MYYKDILWHKSYKMQIYFLQYFLFLIVLY